MATIHSMYCYECSVQPTVNKLEKVFEYLGDLPPISSHLFNRSIQYSSFFINNGILLDI